MMTSYAGIQENLIGTNETDMVADAKKGDLEAFNKLVLSYQDRIFNLAVRILGDYALAEDITQNTFLYGLPQYAEFSKRLFSRLVIPNCHQPMLRRTSPAQKIPGRVS